MRRALALLPWVFGLAGLAVLLSAVTEDAAAVRGKGKSSKLFAEDAGEEPAAAATEDDDDADAAPDAEDGRGDRAAGDDEEVVDPEAEAKVEADEDAKAEAADKVKSAQILLKNKDYKGAKRLLLEARKADKGNAEVVVMLGQCEEKLGDPQAALQWYQRALDMLGKKPAGAKAGLRREAAKAVARLDEGAKIVAKYVTLMIKDAEKLKAKNPHAHKTVMDAALRLTGEHPDLAAGGKRGRPADAKKFNGHFYKRFDDNLTWHVAKRACERMGGYLVCIETKEENDFIVKSLSPGGGCYIGFNDEEVEGDWQWVNGEAATFTRWEGPEPNNAVGGENVAVMIHNGVWQDHSGAGRGRFICEWDE